MRATVQAEVASRSRYQTREVKRNPLYQDWRNQIESAMAARDADKAAILRWVTASYQDTMLQRVRYEERAQSARRNSGSSETVVLLDGGSASELPDFRTLSTPASIPLLESLYRRALDDEKLMAALLETVVTQHAVWPWLGEIAGIGTVLAARLLSRLDIRRAPTPSSFWAYCGLATVPGAVYQCTVCGVRSAGTPRASGMPQHRSPDGEICPSKQGYLEPGRQARIAQGRPRSGESRTFDAGARAICYLIGVSFARKGIGYKSLMNARYAHGAKAHPEWPPKRLYLSAQRFAVKRFLADLWIEWRQAEGLPIVQPFATRASSS